MLCKARRSKQSKVHCAVECCEVEVYHIRNDRNWITNTIPALPFMPRHASRQSVSALQIILL